MALKRQRIENSIEEQIITGIIVSDPFARQIIPIIRKEYFLVESVAIVFSWCQQYFNSYKGAPKQHIQDMYQEFKSQYNDDQQDLLSLFLKNLSSQYEQEEEFNVQYRIDQTKKYIKRRSLELLSKNLQDLIDKGRIDKAELEVNNYRQTVKDTSEWVNPFDKAYIQEVMLSEEEGADHIFRFPGALGKLVGWCERSNFFLILASMKKGKSFLMQEIAVLSAMNRKKVAFFTLEMSAKRVERRIMKRITASDERDGDHVYPCFDCLKNQQNQGCTKMDRVNRLRLLDEEGNKPRFSKSLKYKPCTICRDTPNFIPATWYTVKSREKITMRKVLRKASGLRKMYGDNFRVKSFPAYSANLTDIRSCLQALEFSENFIPDVIIIDYATILKPEDSRVADQRARLNETGMALKNLADSRNCLVVSAAQGTRKSIDKKSLGATDIAEDIRLFAHIDTMIAISQTPLEKNEGVQRISVIGKRDDDFDENRQCLILQQRSLSQIVLDSEMIRKKKEDGEEDIFTVTLDD